MDKSLYKVDSTGDIEYIGYYELLDIITKLIQKVPYQEKLVLIDKYIEIVKSFNK